MEKDNPALQYAHRGLAYGLAVATAVFCVVIAGLLRVWLPGSEYALLLAGVALTAFHGGLGPGLLTAGLCTAGLAFPIPFGPETQPQPLEMGALVISFGVGGLLSMLCHHARVAHLQIRALSVTQSDLIRRERAAEDRYEELLDGLDAVVWEADGDLQLIRISRRISLLLGFSVVDCLTTTDFWARVLSAEAWEELLARCVRVRETGREEEWEHPILARDGGTRWVRSRVGAGQSDTGAAPVFRGTMVDVTDRHTTEETLRRSEDWYRRIVDTAFEGIWLLDATGKTAFINDRMAQMLGATPEALTGRPWTDFTHPDDRASAERYLHQVRRGRKLQRDFRLQRVDGSTVWGLASASAVRSASGEFSGILAMVTEVTDRKRAEDALRFLAEASGLLTSSLDYVATLEHLARLAVPTLAEWCVVDVTEGDAPPRRLAVAHANAASETRLRAWIDAVPLDLNRPLPIANVLRSGEAALVTDVTVGDVAGLGLAPGLVPACAMIVPLRARGRTLGAISFVRSHPGRYGAEDMILAEDLARRAAIALDNARLYQELQRADQRKDAFLAMLAHELRNPLSPVRNGMHLLREKPEDEATVLRVQEVVDRQVRHLTRLTDDLLDVSRITRGKIELRRERLDLTRLVTDVLEDHRASLENTGLRVRLSVPNHAVWIDGDATRLAQVVGNLLVNGGKFTDPGGEVSIQMRADVDHVRAWVSVRDTGIGIPRDVLPHVFETFTQADGTLDRSRGGLGLGLAVVKGLVELHGGQVRVESAGEGRGAELTFWVPLVGLGAGVPGPRAGSHKPAPFPEHRRPGTLEIGLRILVIEDNVDAAETLQDLLEAFGHRVTLAHSGNAGVETARRECPEVVLCDIGLPGLDGYGVARALRDDPETEGVRLIAVTGYGQEEDRRRSLDAGFDIHLTKPVDPDQLKMHLASMAQELLILR